ncbi:MAG: phosphate ABC transporter substrate-binding protein PstS [Phycisphaerales bacterium]|nr:phosphate ABC transporter substrate-binding protein PstS [Phycisphaerales bacterium]
MRFWQIGATALAAMAFLGASIPTARGETQLQGAGASFPAPLYAKWVAAYNKAHSDVVVDYQSVGSGAGITQITAKKVHFAGSDAPLTAEQEKQAGADILHIPTVAGPVVLIYNVPGVKESLKLNGDAVAGIYLKEIKSWNDPKIAALNPGVTLPRMPIQVVRRADGSGTTFIFTSYLSAVSKAWAEKIGAKASVDWPAGLLTTPKNDGVATMVKNTPGAIGYVEAAYATQNKLAYAKQINKEGKEVTASTAGVVAAASTVAFPADLKISIVNAAGADAYPIAGYTYILVHQDLSYLKDRAAAKALVKFLDWCVSDAQKMTDGTDYAPLPPEVQKKVQAKLRTITFDGKPVQE